MSELTNKEKKAVDKVANDLGKIFAHKLYSSPKSLYKLLFYFSWIAGIVISKGFWSCTFAIFIPPWSLYLFIEKVLIAAGLV